MASSKIEKPEYISADETCITVKVHLESDSVPYKLAWKQHPQSWQDATHLPIHGVRAEKITLEATDLLPATTYFLRVENDLGEFGDSLIVDTEAVNCTPKASSCCVLQ